MFPTNSERLIGISDAFSAFVYGYLSSCPRAHCTPNKSVTTLRYTRRHGPVYTGLACRHLPSAVPWISEYRLLALGIILFRQCNAQSSLVSRFGLAVRQQAGKQKGLGSIPLRFSFLLNKGCGLWKCTVL